MVHMFAILCCLSTICLQRGQAFFSPKTQLLFSSVMFRHGDRTPDELEVRFLPQLATNNTYQPIGMGQLTDQGKYRIHSNGVMVRKMYNKFLGNVVDDGNVITYTTNYPRTGASALAFLAGLFPPSKEQQWTPVCKPMDVVCALSPKPELPKLWNPMPYTYDPAIADEMLDYFLKCSAFESEGSNVENLPEFQQKLEKYEELFQYITANTGIEIDSQKAIMAIVSFLIAKTQAGEEMPGWVVPVWDEMLEVMELIFQIMFYNDKQKQLSGGPITLRIIIDMVAKASGTLLPNNRKLVIYSGHDMTVAALYAASGGSKGFVDLKGNPAPVNYPSFGATLFVELHRIVGTGQHAVKILYHNNKAKEPQILRLVGCSELCPLDKYIALTKSTTITREEQLKQCLLA